MSTLFREEKNKMSDRLQPGWSKSLGEMFGELGEIGEQGELEALKLLRSLDIKCKWNPADEVKQKGGLDIEILIDEQWYGIDVKTNLHNDGNKKVCIDYPVLKETEAKYWLHINLENPNDFIIYPVDSMVELARAESPTSEGLRWVYKDSAECLK